MANLIQNTIRNYRRKRLFGYGPTDDWSYVDKMQGPSKDIKLLGMYAGVAYRCINIIAEAMGDLYRPYLYSIDKQGHEQTVATHPLLDLLHNPNNDLSFYQLIEGCSTFTEQFGEFFLYFVPGSLTGYNKGAKQIYLLRPDRMGISVNKATGEVQGFTYNTGTGNNAIPFTPEEILQQMSFNPSNPYRGYGTVEAAANYLRTEEEVSQFTQNYFRNNAAMSGLISVNGKVSKDSWNSFVRQWRERYQGVH